MQRSKLTHVLTWMILVITGSVHGQPTVQQLDRTLDSLFAEYNDPTSPGVIVSVAQHGKTFTTRSFGSADLEHRVPVSVDTRFHIASLTKQFTAYLIAQLEQEGKLALTDEVHRFLPELPDFGMPITVDELIHHTSGLRSHYRLLLFQGRYHDAVITQKDVLALIMAQRELNFPSGTAHMYGNAGYVLLATIVERLEGKPYGTVLQERIFDPLGMTRTSLMDDHSGIMPERAEPYLRTANGFEHTSAMLRLDYGHIGIWSTAADMFRWQQHLRTHKEMLRKGRLKDGMEIPYAFGLYVEDSAMDGRPMSVPRWSHTGDGGGHTSYLAHYPAQDVDVVMLSNIYESMPIAMAEAVITLFLPTLSVEQNEGLPAFQPDPELLGNYTGTYLFNGADLVVQEKDGTLALVAPDGTLDPLIAENDSTFRLVPAQMVLRFAPAVERVTITFPDAEFHCPRKAEAEVHVDAAGLVGRYRSSELDVSISIDLVNDTMELRTPKGARIVLSPTGPDLFRGTDRYYRTAQFQRNEGGRPTGVRFTDYDGRVRNLLFSKEN